MDNKQAIEQSLNQAKSEITNACRKFQEETGLTIQEITVKGIDASSKEGKKIFIATVGLKIDA